MKATYQLPGKVKNVTAEIHQNHDKNRPTSLQPYSDKIKSLSF